jgi:hypothetical protein
MVEAAKPIPPRPGGPAPASDAKPIIGGRLWIGIGLLVAFGALANPVVNTWVIQHAPPEDIHTDQSQWRAGKEADVRVTLVTADATRLACAQAKSLESTHCGFTSEHVPWPQGPDTLPDDNGLTLIQPYRTSPDNLLILLSGLWAQPEVAMRLHREPPGSVSQTKRLQRFDVTCRVKFLDQFDKVDLRWDPTGSWQTERNAWVAQVKSCTVNNG